MQPVPTRTRNAALHRVALRLAAGAWFAASVLHATPAAAFCRTTTAPVSAGCPPTGNPLFWRNACVGYRVAQSGSVRIEASEANRVAALGFDVWGGSACAAGGAPSINAVSLGLSTQNVIGISERGPNENLIVFKDDKWPYPEANQVALTTVSYRKDTGEILDADMEINTTLAITSADPTPRNGFDFQSVIAHEAGHFLGLAHTDVVGATMFPKYVPGTTTLRSLEPDDAAGLCKTYEPTGTRATGAGPLKADTCDPNASPLSALSAPASGCCATAPGGLPRTQAAASCALGAFMLSALWLRRRRVSQRV